MNLRNRLLNPLGALVLSLVMAPAAHATVIADIIFVIDDSVSMGGDIAQVKANIVTFNSVMIANSIDANYGLVRFGGPNQTVATYGYSDHASVEQGLVDFPTFNAGGSPFQNLTAPTSALEKGSVGVIAAFLGSANTLPISFRPGSVKNIILITDEDDDSSLAEFAQADALLGANDALFNFIGQISNPDCSAGAGNTESRYSVLAANHGGTCFDIDAFRADPQPFFDNFTTVKVAEIISKSVPEPTTLLLLGLGLAGLGLARKRLH